MKRVSLSILALIVLAATATAQVKFGGKAGINLAKFSGKSDGVSYKTDSKIGLHIGGLAEFPITKSFSVMPEINFDQLGGQESQDLGPLGTIEAKYMLNYISVPVLAKYNAGGLGIYAGPQIGLLVNAKGKVGNEKSDIKDQLKATDFSAIFGAEYNLPHGFFVSARYNLGLTKNNDQATSNDYTRSRSITVGLGIKFGG